MSAEVSRRALAEMIEGARALGLAVFLAGPAPVHDLEQNRRTQSLSRSFAETCQERGARCCATVEALLASPTWMAEVARADGAHPGTDGYDAPAALLIDEGLRTWLVEPIAAKPAAANVAAR